MALAVGFTVLLNLLLATALVWRQWLPVRVQSIGGGLLVTIWVLAWAEARADWRRYLAELSTNGEDPQQRADRQFQLAQRSYLAGDWVATEQHLLTLLRKDAADIEGRLLLATMWRRLGRFDDACRELDRLEKMEAAASWQAEVDAERRRLEPSPEASAAPPRATPRLAA